MNGCGGTGFLVATKGDLNRTASSEIRIEIAIVLPTITRETRSKYAPTLREHFRADEHEHDGEPVIKISKIGKNTSQQKIKCAVCQIRAIVRVVYDLERLRDRADPRILFSAGWCSSLFCLS